MTIELLAGFRTHQRGTRFLARILCEGMKGVRPVAATNASPATSAGAATEDARLAVAPLPGPNAVRPAV